MDHRCQVTNNPVMGLVGHSWYGLGTVWFMNVHIDDYHFIGAHIFFAVTNEC